MTALAAGHDVLARTPSASVLVALSGGKDSLVTLDMCCRHFPHVEAFFMYRVEGLRCELGPIEAAARRHKVPVHYVPHWSLSTLLKYNALRLKVEGADSLRALAQQDVESFLRAKTGIDWFAYGEKCADSLVRNAKLKQFGGIDLKRKRVYPAWRFKKADVMGYLHARKISIPKMQGGGVYSGGVTLDVDSLTWLRDFHPDDYARVCAVFPFAPAVLYRREKFGDPLDDVRNHKKWLAKVKSDGQGREEDGAGPAHPGARADRDALGAPEV